MKQLLYQYLNELLFLYGSEYFFAKVIEIVELNVETPSLKARCYGEVFDRERHVGSEKSRLD